MGGKKPAYSYPHSNTLRGLYHRVSVFGPGYSRWVEVGVVSRRTSARTLA